LGAKSDIANVRGFPSQLSALEISGLLSPLRSARLTGENPDFVVREVVIIERASVFTTDSSMREAFLEHVRLSRFPDLLAREGKQEFEIRWLTLLDAIRDSSLLSVAQRDCARRVLETTPADALTFLVDRVDSDTATLDVDLANIAFTHLTYACLAGDLGAERTDGVSTPLPPAFAPTQRRTKGNVVPFSLAVIDHSARVIEEARLRSFRRRFALGAQEPLARGGTPTFAGGLRGQLESEQSRVDELEFDRHVVRRERWNVVRDLLTSNFMAGRPLELLAVLATVRRLVSRFNDRARTFPNEARATRSGLALIGITGSLPIVIGAAGMIAAAAVVWIARRRANPDASPGTFGDPPEDQKARQELAHEWMELVDALDLVADEWEKLCTSVRGSPAPEPHVEWEGRPPFAVALSTALELHEAIPITHGICRTVAENCCQSLRDGILPRDAFAIALRSGLATVGPGRAAHALGGEIAKLLVEDRHGYVRRFIGQRPFLLASDRPIDLSSVVWMSEPSLNIEESLLEMEPSTTRSAASHFSHDDATCSVRLAFGDPIHWTEVTSLALAVAEDG